MAGLPKLPGYTFNDPTVTKFHLSQSFELCNGYKIPKNHYSGIGGRELEAHSIKYLDKKDPVKYDPSLTYGRVKSRAQPQYLPHFALYDKKCLAFRAFFKQSVVESPLEFYRVRPVNITYFLEDDTITVIEPRVENSGLLQGKLMRRAKIPKYNDGNYWHWKDFQIGKDLCFYGTVFHTVDCDLFTREFMASQGLTMDHPEEMPPDPYTYERKLQVIPHVTKTPPADDKRRRFLEFDGKVLRFKAVWDDRENLFGELGKFEIFYFLADDTVLVKSVIERNSGKDPYPILLRKTKLPKIYTDTPITYPAVYLELSDAEVKEYYQPKDFLVGETIFVLGRDLLLYDCDKFTRDYYKNAYGIIQKPPIDIEEPKPKAPAVQVPPHDGLGSLEDSLQNTLTFLPKPPKKDVLRQILNANKNLRYEMVMDAVHPEDTIRKFILFYSLANGACKIIEPPIRNSGIIGGTYLRSTPIVKPDSDPLNPVLYTPADFYIGATITVFSQRFIITGADLYVYRYMEQNSSKFPCEVIDNMRNYMFNKGYLKGDIEDLAKEAAEAEELFVQEMKDQEVQKTEMEKCFAKMKVDVKDGAYDKAKRAEIQQQYEESIKHTYKVPPFGIKETVKECPYPVHVGKQRSSECKDEEGQYTSYTPKHVDTPEEIIQKYYKGVLKDQHKVCSGEYPIECTEPPSREVQHNENPEGSTPQPILVTPTEIPPESCLYENKKTVRFVEDGNQCLRNRHDLCNLKQDVIHCECTDYKREGYSN